MSNHMQSGADRPSQAQSQPVSPHLWTASDVARYARCSLRQVGYLREEGLPFVRIGRLVRFDPPRVTAWLLRQSISLSAIQPKEVAL
jgi:hypothetical protein